MPLFFLASPKIITLTCLPGQPYSKEGECKAQRWRAWAPLCVHTRVDEEQGTVSPANKTKIL